MIRIQHEKEPDGFKIQTEKWWDEFQKSYLAGAKLSLDDFWSRIRKRKAMQGYAEQLNFIFYGKCSFCESKIGHVSPVYIEHYRPKSRAEYQKFTFAWENWLLTCATCNTNKGIYFEYCEVLPCLIDPTTDDPTEHIGFVGAQILYKTTRGQKTIEQIKLNRIKLEQERARWLINVGHVLLLAIKVPEARNFLIWAMQSNAPYAGMTRAYLNKFAYNLANPKFPHPIIKIEDYASYLSNLLQEYKDDLQKL